MIEQLKEILIPYLPTLMSSGMACLVAMFLKKANASSLVLKTDKREILDHVDKVTSSNAIITDELKKTFAKTNGNIQGLSDDLHLTMDALADVLTENKTLHEQLEQIKKELIELKATVRKKED